MSFAEANMARSGLKRDSPAWKENLTNVQREQEKERLELAGGETAGQLKKQFSKYVYPNMYNQMRTSSIVMAKDQHRYSGAEGEFTTEMARGVADQFNKQAQAQYDKGEWVKEKTFEVKKGADDAYAPDDPNRPTETRHTGVYEVTAGGALKLQELMESDDNEFGRKLEGWEAYGYLRYGASSQSLSPEERSMERAKEAASGQRQGGRTSAEAAAAESVDEGGAGASPWVKKKEAGTIF